MIDRISETKYAAQDAKSLARPVAGYLRVYRRYQAIRARLDRKLDACAPLRRQAAELRDQLKVREGRLTGGQLAAVRRALAPTRNSPVPPSASLGALGGPR